MIVAASDGNNVRPVGNVAPAVFVIARRNDRAVGFEAYRVIVAASDRLSFGDVIPKSKAALASILVISGATERYRRIFVFSVFIKRNGSIIFAVWNDHSCQNDYKCYARRNNRRADGKSFFELFCRFFCRYAPFFGFALVCHANFLDFLLAGKDLFVRILPAGNGLEQLNRFFARSYTALG